MADLTKDPETKSNVVDLGAGELKTAAEIKSVDNTGVTAVPASMPSTDSAAKPATLSSLVGDARTVGQMRSNVTGSAPKPVANNSAPAPVDKPTVAPVVNPVAAVKPAPAADAGSGVKMTSNPFPDQVPSPQIPNQSQSQPQTQSQAVQQPIGDTLAQDKSKMVAASAVNPAVQPMTANLTQSTANMQQNQQPVQPQQMTAKDLPGIVEETVVVKRGRGCSPFSLFRFSCRTIACLGCVLPVLLIVLVIALVVIKPDPVWKQAKSFVNAGKTSKNYTEIPGKSEPVDIETILGDITPDEQGIKTVTFTEEELANILSDKFPNSRPTFVNVSANKVSFLINLDNKKDPLWIYVDLKQSNNKLTIDKAGAGRAALPEKGLELVRKNMNKALDFANLEKSNELFNEILGDKYEVTELSLQDNNVIIKVKTVK